MTDATQFLNLLLGASLVALPGCLPEPRETRRTDHTVEVFSWWSTPSEAGALRELLDVHAARFPDVKVIRAADSQAEIARTRLADRLAKGSPPDTFQTNAGVDLIRWVRRNGTDADGSKLERLDDLREEHDWDELFSQVVRDALSENGHLYGVPLNIHRDNTLFYNKGVLNKLGLSPPENLEELHTLLKNLQAAGYSQPLALGNRDRWPMWLLFSECLLPSLFGPTFYETYWTGQEKAEDPRIIEGLRELLRLLPYINADASTLDWSEGVDLIFDQNEERQAVLTVMGDWAKGHLQASGLQPGEDFGQLPFPGSSETFVYTMDAFPLPKGAPNPEDARHLLETFGSREGQVRFSAVKGSLPAREDIEPEEDLDALSLSTWRDFHSNDVQALPALSALIEPAIVQVLWRALSDTVEDEALDPMLFALRNNYPDF